MALYKVAAAVSIKAMPKLKVMTFCTTGLEVPKSCNTHSVSKAAGTLPKLRLNTTRQGMMRWRAKFNMPPALVPAANSKSVPTAKAGLTPKPKISKGVMSEPPPTPVRPTMKPTTNPARMNAKSSIRARL